jgi:hypothetical protein
MQCLSSSVAGFEGLRVLQASSVTVKKIGRVESEAEGLAFGDRSQCSSELDCGLLVQGVQSLKQLLGRQLCCSEKLVLQKRRPSLVFPDQKQLPLSSLLLFYYLQKS